MNQNIWGPHAWFLLHTLSLAYPLKPTQKDKDDYMSFLQGFGKVVPCEICKVHFARNLRENPPTLENREDVFKWTVDLHNEINGRTGKRAFTYQEAHKLYQEKYQKDIPLNASQVPKANFRNFLQKICCFWIKYHAYIVILILLGIIFQMSGGWKEIQKKLPKTLK